MRTGNKYTSGLIAVVSLAAMMLLSLSCSERSVESSDQVAVEFEIAHPQGAPASPELLNVYQLRIVDVRLDSVLKTIPLIPDGGFLHGSATVRTDRLLRYEAEAIDDKLGVVVYYGETTAILGFTRNTTLTIDMSPVVPVLKFTPRYIEETAASTFVSEIKLFNVDSLFGISFQINYDGNLFFLDSVVAGDFPPADTVIFFGRVVDFSTYAVSVTHTNQAKTIVDASGNATLARAHFTLVQDRPPTVPSPSVMTMDTTGFSYPSGAAPSFSVFFTDALAVEIPPL
jgi:hypothetical protein